ncbi:MAG: protein translocase subunit SecD [Phycisphaeraceae bacterium]|nr:protein translocase subunit SecD [Phycisphaeraceae bacterium]
MRNLGLRAALVIVALLFFGLAIVPPEKKLRLGKDLSGGVSLIYSVAIGPDENASETMSRVIEVLKRRVDPNGLYQITMVSQGRDRIEITMPLPGPRVKEKRAEYEAMLDSVGEMAIPRQRLERVIAMSPVSRAAELDRLAGGNEARAARLRDLAVVYDEARAARASYDAAADAEQPDADELLRLARAAAEAELAYDTARDDLLRASLTPAELRRAVEQSSRRRTLRDSQTNTYVELPSPRDRALTRLKERYPAYSDSIDRVRASYEAYEAVRTTLDDPSDLVRLLRASGVLAFRITVDPGDDPSEEARLRSELRESGPRGARSRDKAWYKINRVENWYNDVQELRALEANPAEYFRARGYVVDEFDGEYYMLCWDRAGYRLAPDPDRPWQVARARQGADEVGKPAIAFEMDTVGASLLGALTEKHVGKKMAIVLDDEVYTAPTLRSRISRSGLISGDFSNEELRYIIQVLAAGALQNKLSPEPISRNTVGPDFGADKLREGLRAGIIAFIAVSGFMVVYYFRCGALAVVGLCCNATLLLGAMALNSAAFTLPGIAGIILTFGMAVDANVLIYERIREELRAGLEIRPAVRLGFSKALSSIVDGNVTNLIVCVVLAYLGTQEIRGFAITLGIGVVTTMFSALVITRLMFDVLLEFGLWRRIRMLPTVLPAIDRALEPKINWLRMRYGFVVISAVYVGIGLWMVYYQRGEMFDTEFRGGTKVTLQFKIDEDTGRRVTLTRQEVEDRVRALGQGTTGEVPLEKLRRAQIVTLDPAADGVTSDRFEIKSLEDRETTVVNALATAFADVLDSRPPLVFRAAGLDFAAAPVYPLLNVRGILGEDINRPEYRDVVREYSGGVAIVLEDFEPRPTLEGLRTRIEQMRQQQDFSDTLGRTWEVRALEEDADGVRTAVLLVAEEGVNYLENEDRWRMELAAREWQLVNEALARTTTLASVQSFSPAIAATFKAQAIVAVFLSLLLIMIYIWVRFGSARYSLAAIACLVHDCLTCIGLIALAEIVYDWGPTQSAAQAIGILPFKIDLTLVAALLTIIGYSLNDTIIVMDRVRENRGKMPYASADVINLSINQTISRTVITSGTTLLAILIMYVYGGDGVRGFAYAMLIGIGIGTYSSIAVAAPLVWSRKADRSAAPPPDEPA